MGRRCAWRQLRPARWLSSEQTKHLHTISRLVHTASMQTTTQDLKAISERYFAAWAAHDPDAIVALHTEDTQFWTHLGAGPVRGCDAVRAAFAEVFAQFP